MTTLSNGMSNYICQTYYPGVFLIEVFWVSNSFTYHVIIISPKFRGYYGFGLDAVDTITATASRQGLCFM